MTLIHIYDNETGEYIRSQEPVIDELESKVQGKTIYVTYPYSTDIELPECNKNERLYFVDGQWKIHGHYKNLDVYNKSTKTFEYCDTEELGENQVYIDDPEGIQKFKDNYQKYIVDENSWKIVENPNYDLVVKLDELNKQLSKTEEDYNAILDTPVEFPVTGKLYKPRWTEDGTYANLLVAKSAGLGNFPIDIWDATKLEENKVNMDETTFGQLCAFLVNIQTTAFDARKAAQAKIIPQINEINVQLGNE